MIYNLITIYRFFTKHNPKAQDKKLDEEITELIEAYNTYKHTPNKANFMAMLLEVADCSVITHQKAIVEYGLNMDEIQAMYNMKVERTIKLIKECNGDPEKYDEVRYRRKYEKL